MTLDNMNSGDDSSQLLQTLLAAIRDDALTDEQIAQLDMLLADDENARKTYLDYVQLCADLRSYHGTTPSSQLMVNSEKAGLMQTENNLSFFSTFFRQWGIITGVLAAILLVITLFLYNDKNADLDTDTISIPREIAPQSVPDQDEMQKTMGVAVLTKVANAIWKDESHPTVGNQLLPGRLKLTSGLIQIEFYQGAIVILEGPADFELIDSQRAFLHQGKLRSFVPMPSRGFVIDTPQRKLIDHGTEFGLDVDGKGVTSVHVFEGKVEMKGKKSEFLLQGESKQFSKEDTSTVIPFDETSFYGPTALALGSNRELFRRKQKWEKQTKVLSKDSSALAYYLFDKQGDWGRSLKDMSHTPHHGAIVGCRRAEGRWMQNNALEFKRITDRVRISIPGEFQSLTFMAWIRIEGYDQWLSAIMLTDGFNHREVHWQMSDKSRLILGVSNHGSPVNYYSPKILKAEDLGRWVHLATVYDHQKKHVAHYIDGQVICKLPIKTPLKLRIGKADIGNWSYSKRGVENSRPLNGLIDEFAIFSRSFDSKEIQNIYLIGKPD